MSFLLACSVCAALLAVDLLASTNFAGAEWSSEWF